MRHPPRTFGGPHNEARLALDFATVSNRVMPYSQIPFRQMIIRHARDNIQSALPAWLEDLQVADRKARGSLSKTLRAYADANMNALQTAKDLSVHPNTIYSPHAEDCRPHREKRPRLS